MIKAVIFDLNGVFLKSRYLTDRLEEKYGVRAEKILPVLKEVMAIAQKPGVEDSFTLWKPKLAKLGIKVSREEFFDLWFSGEELAHGGPLFVKELKDKGLKLFVLSNNFKERTEYYRIRFADFFSRFDGVYFSHETGFVKPDPGAYQNILFKNGLSPENCVYFDDSEKNVAMAQGLGIRAQKYDGLLEMKKFLRKLGAG